MFKVRGELYQLCVGKQEAGSCSVGCLLTTYHLGEVDPIQEFVIQALYMNCFLEPDKMELRPLREDDFLRSTFWWCSGLVLPFLPAHHSRLCIKSNMSS